VYLNLEGQSRMLKAFRPEITADLAQFLEEFCTENQSWNFEDAGRQPQAADKKLQGMCPVVPIIKRAD
jgi:hypothetical protein